MTTIAVDGLVFDCQSARNFDPARAYVFPLLKAGVAERSGATEGLSSGVAPGR